MVRNCDCKPADDALVISIPLGPKTEIPKVILWRDADEDCVISWSRLEYRTWRVDYAKQVMKGDTLPVEVKSVVLPPIMVKTKRL